MTELLYEAESYAIRGACFEVYKEKGSGFLESVYRECMEIELEFIEIPFVVKPQLQLDYKNRKLKSKFEPDLVCYDKIIVELKAVSQLVDEHRAQVHNYLKATGYRLGFLVNFGHHPKVQIERIVR
jgi:GxxExxY protein